jgi:predicted nucleotide-binding protein (sugar kinase/HSP70/actin superfamily)
MIGGCGPCPFYSYTLAFALQLRKSYLWTVPVTQVNNEGSYSGRKVTASFIDR